MKRVKRQVKKAPNPLFEEWLIDWQKDAAEKESDMQYCFGKALRSLRKYPFPLQSGKECIILENFGKKICDMLDKRLAEHKKMLTEEEWLKSQSLSSFNIGASTSSASQKVQTVPNSNGTAMRVSSPTFDDDEEPAVVSQSACSKSSTKSYVPKYRSGAFAVLIALINSDKAGMTKEEIQSRGQDFCDVSFTKPLPGSFYTAWSSVATLLKKDLVVKLKSRPIKFQLTESGRELAKKLKCEMNKVENNEPGPSNDIEPLLLSSPPKPQKRKAPVRKKVSPLKAAKKPATVSHESQINYGFSDGILTVPSISQSSISTVASSSNSQSSYSRNAQNSTKINHESHFGSIDNGIPTIPPFSQSSRSTVASSSQSSKPRNTQKGSSVTLTDERSTSSSQSSQETIFLSPGQFDIILLVDIHETEMKKKERIDVTLKELQKRGIRCESRHLTVGDFVWICRDRLTTSSELVLPYIVERKRMDDFGKSIKDGRFHEQKFRLKQSGLSNMIYLVEKFGKDNQRLGLPLSTIQQAAVNTQVVDGFAVKFSQDHDDSIRYLVCFTQQLIQRLRMKTFMSCAKNDLDEFRLDSDLISLMSFSEFNKGSSKIKNFTVKEMLIKQLLQLKGLSVEKATVIADRYGTPSALMEALEVGGEKLLADLPCGALRRLGPASATSIHQLYTRMILE